MKVLKVVGLTLAITAYLWVGVEIVRASIGHRVDPESVTFVGDVNQGDD